MIYGTESLYISLAIIRKYSNKSGNVRQFCYHLVGISEYIISWEERRGEERRGEERRGEERRGEERRGEERRGEEETCETQDCWREHLQNCSPYYCCTVETVWSLYDILYIWLFDPFRWQFCCFYFGVHCGDAPVYPIVVLIFVSYLSN